MKINPTEIFLIAIGCVLIISLFSIQFYSSSNGPILGQVFPAATAQCQGTSASCGSFTAQTPCASQGGCSWLANSQLCPSNIESGGNCCSGSSTSCSSYPDQNSCQNQEGCTWFVPPTSTTPSSTTTTPINTMNETAAAQNFSANNFNCKSVPYGFGCNINSTNNLNESAIVTFLFIDSDGNVLSNSIPVAMQGNSQVAAIYNCPSSGKIYVSWKAYRLSDSSLSNAIAWSKSTEQQFISC